MSNPLYRGQNINNGLMQRLQLLQKGMQRPCNPQQISQNIMSMIQQNPQYNQQLQDVRRKYGENKSATEIAQILLQENGINPNFLFRK